VLAFVGGDAAGFDVVAAGAAALFVAAPGSGMVGTPF
jgi:hypothetical protein